MNQKNEMEFLKAVDQLYGKASLSKEKMLRKWENVYDPGFGFRLAIERLHGIDPEHKGKVPFVVSSMLPPGRLYQPEITIGPDVGVFFNINYEKSKWNSVLYEEEMNFVGL